MTKATLSLPSPNPSSYRQKKKPCPPGESAGFQARISAEFTGGAATAESAAARGHVSSRKTKQNKTPRKNTIKKTQINTQNQNNKPKTAPAEQPWPQTSHRGDMLWRWAGCTPSWGSSRTGKSRSKLSLAWVREGPRAPAL